MEMKLAKAGILIGGVALVLTIFWAARAQAQSHTHACYGLVPGTYLTRVVDQTGAVSSRSVMALHADGTFVNFDSNEGGVPNLFNPFTAQAGSWACSGGTSFVVTALDFVLPSPATTMARVDYRVNVDPHTGNLDGVVELRLFGIAADPFKDAGQLIGSFPFTGQRFGAQHP
jgi:hypothetical protein